MAATETERVNQGFLPSPVAIARITKAYGTSGEVAVKLTDYFNEEKPVFIYFDGLPVPFFIDSYTKRGNNGAIVKFSTVNTYKESLSLVGKDIFISADTLDDSQLSEYFSDYSVVYETAALKAAGSTAVWAKGDTEPWYLKVDPKGETVTATIQFTRLSDNKPDSEVRTYTLAPSKSWTLSIAPQDNNGSIDIDITIDESTDDEEIDIEVPSEWL